MFQPDGLCVVLLGEPGGLPLWRLFLVEPRGFEVGGLSRRFQTLQEAGQFKLRPE